MLEPTAMGVALKKLTWEDLKDLPESHGRTELVGGELVFSPTPSLPHPLICDRLAGRLGAFGSVQPLLLLKPWRPGRGAGLGYDRGKPADGG